jgi:hypothetical protein
MIPYARLEEYRMLRQRIGTSRNVVVTPSAYVTDNRPTVDGIARLGSILTYGGNCGSSQRLIPSGSSLDPKDQCAADLSHAPHELHPRVPDLLPHQSRGPASALAQSFLASIRGSQHLCSSVRWRVYRFQAGVQGAAESRTLC